MGNGKDFGFAAGPLPGSSVGSEELPSQRKGPLSCNERSTFYKVHLKGSLL